MASKDIRSFFQKVTNKATNNTTNRNETISSIQKESCIKSKLKKKIEVVSSDTEDDLIEISCEASKNKKYSPGKSRRGEKKPKSSRNLSSVKSSNKSKVVIDSDGDDSSIISATPEKPDYKKRKIIDSGSENEETQLKKVKNIKKQGSTDKLKPVSILDIFSNTVKQSKLAVSGKSDILKKDKNTVTSKRKKNTEIGVHEDKAFEKTLIDLDDDDIFLQNEDILDKTIESAKQEHTDGLETDTQGSCSSSRKNLNASSLKVSVSEIDHTPRKKQHVEKKRTSESERSAKKPKLEHTDSGIDDQERYEKKRYYALQYQQYLHRSGPKNHGSKELPKGKPDCLANLCFLRTGVLDSLESEEFESLIKQYSGRVVHAVSKKVNYVVAGEEAGPSKLSKAQNFGIPIISENELLDMILQKSGLPKKYTIQAVSSFEDAGINDSFVSNESEQDPCKTNKKILSESMNEIIVAKPLAKKETDKNNEDCKISVKTESQPENIVREEKMGNTRENSNKNEKSGVGSENSDIQSLSEKYKPQDLKQIVGQQMNKSNMNKLKEWLECWHEKEKLRREKKIQQPKPWDKTNDGSYYKCALLSGPPGVGKTTTATLVSEYLGYDIVEFNASDTRSKKLLQQEVATALSTHNISSFNSTNNAKLDKKRVILMDEVDGMAGNEDRGGMQELIALIKISKIPIICMCNDRNHQKIRTLANYCYDLRFEKPKLQQILGFVMSICCKEGIKVSPQVATEIINGTTCDIRQTLNQLSMLANLNSGISLEQARKDSTAAKKDIVLGPWQVCKMVFTEAEQKNLSLIDKSRLFFYDYSLGPLFVQENYLKVHPHVDSKDVMKHVASAADAISMGATIDKKIREINNWSLLDMQAMYSSVLPGYYMSGHFTAAIDFPGWLGKNSKRTKLKRMNTELAMHTKIQTSGGALAMNLDYSKALLLSIVTPLKKKGMNGVSDAVEVMKSYQLLREDLDSLVELCTIPKQKSLMDGIDSKVKAAFTRLYNKEVPVFSYSTGSGVSKRKTTIYDEQYNEEEADENSESEDTIENDTLIKSKMKKKTTIKDPAKPSTSKQNRGGRGKR